MTDIAKPHKKLHLLLERIGVNDDDMKCLDPFRDLFIARKDAFAEYFYDSFLDIPDTRPMLEDERTPGLMKRVWAVWFEAFFRTAPDDGFLAYLWRVGVRHVEVGLDQRYSNLGFALIRQFCHGIAAEMIPAGQRSAVISSIDKMVDLCLLAETTAYIENTVSCDMEVMREVADRVRNPAMVIGWNIRKLQGKVDEGTREHGIYRMLMSENERLENMVNDIKIYIDLFHGEPLLKAVEVGPVINAAIGRLDAGHRYPGVTMTVGLDEQARFLRGDPEWLGHLFYYLIQNSFEAVDEKAPVIRVSSSVEAAPPFNITIEIFNSGSLPPEEMERLFSPFFSTKTWGTGFGLPIARLVAKKHHATLSIRGGEDAKGTTVLVSFPNPGT